MIRSVIKLGVLLVVGILVYNFFFGTDVEKESSRKVFTEIKEVGAAVGDLLRSEKDKFDEGKYDDALDKIENAFANLRGKAQEIGDSDILDKLAKLDDERERLEQQFETKTRNVPSEFNEKGEKVYDVSERDKKIMQKDLDKLLRETEDVMNQLERKRE